MSNKNVDYLKRVEIIPHLNDEPANSEALIEAYRLRGYEQIDTKDGKISFRRIDDNENHGDTQGWIFQYDNWQKVRESLIDIPLFEDFELTSRIDSLINLTKRERDNRDAKNLKKDELEVRESEQTLEQHWKSYVGHIIENPAAYLEFVDYKDGKFTVEHHGGPDSFMADIGTPEEIAQIYHFAGEFKKNYFDMDYIMSPVLDNAMEIILHIRYREPVEINGLIKEDDVIIFGDEDELFKYIDGEPAFNMLDDSVAKGENEILLYAENDRGEIIWESKKEKQRLFVDMDGTLTEFYPQESMEPIYKSGYFLNLEPHQNVVDAIYHIVKNHRDIEVYVLSAYLSDSSHALTEKNCWLDLHLPEIDREHRIFVPNGSDKKEWIDGLREDDYLLDDYTVNLLRWHPGNGIKLLNEINHTHETWDKDRIRYDRESVELAESIVDIMKGRQHIYDLKVGGDELEHRKCR